MLEANGKINDEEEKRTPGETKGGEEDRNSRSKGFTHQDYAIAWICALPKEQTAAIAMLDEEHPKLRYPRNDNNIYTLGSIRGHNVVITCLPKGEIGTTSAASVVTRLISTFPFIKFGLMVGIGGGIPPVRLGDVVVSVPAGEFPGVVQWDLGKVEGERFKRTGWLDRPPKALLTVLTELETSHDMKGSKIPQYLQDMEVRWPKLVPKYTRRDFLQDPLFLPSESHSTPNRREVSSVFWGAILALLQFLFAWWAFLPMEQGPAAPGETANTTQSDAATEGRRKSNETRIHYGLIASGNKVVKDAELRDLINTSLGGKVLCVEMEAAGLMNNFPCIVIRGICDYADSNKNDDWQEYAATVAAAFGKELLDHVQTYDIDEERAAKEILGEVRSIGADIVEIKSILRKDEEMEILNRLPSIDYSTQHADYFSRRQAGTGQWFLDSEEYNGWLGTSNTTLFCPGIPGAGKTIITAIVINDLHVRFQNDPNVGIAYIYCDFRKQGDQKLEGLLASLLKQLAQNLSAPPAVVDNFFKTHQNLQPSLDQISKALQSVITIYYKTFIIIDALDECQTSDGCRQRLLSEIFKLQTETKANLYATSRFIPDISERFEGCLSRVIVASDEDVRRYLRGNLHQLPKSVSKRPDLQETIINDIAVSAKGMFLLPQLYFRLLEDKTSQNDIKSTLEELQQQVSQATIEDGKLGALAIAYDQTVERIKRQGAGFQRLAEKALSWIVCAKRPLTTLELQHALAVKVGATEFDRGDISEIEDVLLACAGLVTVDMKSSIVRLVHYTAQEYFNGKQKYLFPNAQDDITRVCATYLSFNIFGSGFCRTFEEYERRLESNPLYDYVARNWGYHARETSTLHQEIQHFSECEQKVEAASQVLMIRPDMREYFVKILLSLQHPPRMTRVHLAAYFGLEKSIDTWLSTGDAPDSLDRDSYTPLCYAAQHGHDRIVKMLLDTGRISFGCGSRDHLSLNLAAGYGHETVVRLLIGQHGIDPNHRDSRGDAPLFNAIQGGYKSVVELLLTAENIDINCKNLLDFTPLFYAIKHDHEEIIEMLLETKDIDLNRKTRFRSRQTPLLFALREGHPVAAKLLLATKKIDPNCKDGEGYTPLLHAAEKGYQAVVELLLGAKNVDVNCENYEGYTPLLYAVLMGRRAIVKLLLTREDINMNCRDRRGYTPLLLAASCEHEVIVKLLLAKNRADMIPEDSYIPELLDAAVRDRKTGILKLLAMDGDSDSRDISTQSKTLSRHDAEKVVRIFVEKGWWSKEKALLWAAESGHLEAVRVLLEMGASVNTWQVTTRNEGDIQNHYSRRDEMMPLHLAAMGGHKEVVDLLLD
ncbi:hypothetical protein TWF281_007626 [Arthrobotrys megalospora]